MTAVSQLCADHAEIGRVLHLKVAMSKTLAEFLRDSEVAGRVLRSHASKVAAPNAKQLVYSRKNTGKTEGKKKVGTKRAPAALAAEQEKKPRKSTTKKSTTVVVSETAEVSSTLGLKGASVSSTRAWSVSLSSAEAIAEATKHLLAVDAKFGNIVGKHGAPEFQQEGSSFNALVKSIVYQQLAGKAAATIHGRLVALCGGPESVTPSVIAALTAEELRAVGISGRKRDYLHDLADKFLSGALSDEKLATMSEDDLVSALTAVKGIGVWSAHMFMIFHLHKPDVLPVGDLGIRKGFQKLYQLKKEPSAAEMQELALSWRPYRSLASWYLWRVQ